MFKRLPVLAACCGGAIVVIAACAWQAHVGSIGALLDVQTGLAQSLLDRPGRVDPPAFLQEVGRSGIHVRFVDVREHIGWDWRHGQILQHDGPPPGTLPGDSPGVGVPPGAMPPPGRPPATLAADVAHLRPRVVRARGIAVQLMADPNDLANWFAMDLLATAVALGILAAFLFRARVLRARRAAAEAAQRDAAEAEYRRFLTDAGHELKTPLTIVGGFIDVLDERIESADSTGRRIVDGMRAETKRMRELVEKMLLLARLEARVSVARFVSTLTVAQDVAAELRLRYPQRSIVVDGTERAYVVADEHDAYAAIRNLVENAIRYAPDSTVEVTATILDERVAIAVRDCGPGIPPAEQALIFGRFYRGSARTDAEGSGLGLSIVRGVAERWDGSVDVASSPTGTTFTLFFPLAVESDR